MNDMTPVSNDATRAHDPDRQPWWRGAAIYQVYPRSFADSNGDGVGDLPGITARLDHIAALGVDAVWISPFFRSPMHDHGYDIADHTDVDPLFGTLADVDRLIDRAHALGLRVLIDQVYSHTSDQHPWFAASRASRDGDKADWYVWADPKPDGSPPSNWQSVFGGPAWTWDARRGQYYLHNFLTQQPDLNLHHPAVQDAILSVARFWLDRGVDGFRIDAINFAMHDPALRDNPVRDAGGPRTRPFDFQDKLYNQSHPAILPFLERLSALVKGYGDDRFTVAEVGGDHAVREIRAFTHGADRLDTAYGFTYLYADALTPRVVADAIAAWPGDGAAGWISWAFENHDAPRALTRWAGGRDLDAYARMKAMLLASLRGNIFVYQGEELGLAQGDVPFDRLRDPEAIANWPETLGRDGARTPMPWTSEAPWGGFSTTEPWLPVMADHLARSVAAQDADPGSILHWTRAVLAIRRTSPALRLGAIAVDRADDAVLAVTRTHQRDRVTALFNFSDQPMVHPLPADDEAQPLMATDGVVADRGLVTLPPLGAVWLASGDRSPA